MHNFIFIAFVALFFTACSVEPLQPVQVAMVNKRVNYLQEVKPILEKRCVVCHSCYNSPCQLKFDSYEGLERGSSKAKVYMGERLRAQEPSRLFLDAHSSLEWRSKGFNSVSESNSSVGTNDSIMLQLLDHKMKNPKSVGEYLSESDDLTCAKDTKELAEFLDDNPNQGMPFGFPPLEEKEYKTLAQWLSQGAPMPSEEENIKLKSSSEKVLPQILKYEEFFNKEDAKHVMSARYIYEHLFLAHLSFAEQPEEFYELVRSKTPSPQPIEVIATLRPYDDPGVEKFYYRFKKIHSTIVHKTHMLYDLDDAKLQRYEELFIKSEWNEKPYVVGFKTSFNAEPFKVFEQIPASSRYAFLLDNSEYVVRTFIRGPVCKGQIALNVINDHFWIAFMDPKYDLSLKYPKFLKTQYENLKMPIEAGSDMKLIDTFSDIYNEKAIAYNEQRQKLYDEVYKNGLDLDGVWKGDNASSAPLLTVYRHFDSASVHKGILGNLPKTAWVIDYPLLERIYYSLVAGFDVYGNIGHQASVRRYMSRLRVEGESYFLNFLPKEDREKLFESWYVGAEDEIQHSLSQNETPITFTKINSKREFFENIVHSHLLKEAGISFDKYNYVNENERIPSLPKEYKSKEDYIQGFRSLVKEGTSFIKLVNGNNSNLAYIRVKVSEDEDIVVSVIVNRWHDNVSFMFNESARLDPSKDDLDFVEGLVGSYPNLFLVVELKDLPDFFDMMHNYDGSKAYIAKFLKYGISRGDEDFWEHYDWFAQRFGEQNPHEAGLLDLNRYYYKVLR
ncbi:MAG: peptidylprolyl isomerase [Sulfurimonas sp.]|nr:peptidylprolyl isomerase [Sulfurimonas sp.]MBU3939896.1 fatty acid cis/trans isomerase [bacterium]MBU4025561.1 fatty acid cis/trans isomerase [bacterium]MBU4059992.1 fatty acid cis/trans isomerase [bacterium]MBU4110806.1 fatty acid cis/trans isomerase [bacterium]